MLSQYQMVHPTTQTLVPMFGYPYRMDTPRTTPQNDCYVLDLSVKREPSPDYTMCYPSPEMSPTYPSFGNSTVRNTKIECARFGSGSTVVTNPPKVSPASMSDGTSERSFHSDSSSSPKSKSKSTRPFKALSKDCLTLDLGVVPSASSGEINTLIQESIQAFTEFREKMMEQIRPDTGSNKNMRRVQHNSEKLQDPEYMEKRRKNNEAAKKSRDARKLKQDEMAIRMAFLEREHIMLKCRLDAEKEDLERMQSLANGKLQC